MSDKRSVFTDALETLGTLIDEHQKRDAIHLAVEPVVAGEDLNPGQDIGLGEDGRAYNTLSFCQGKHLGIVDPFLSKFDVVIQSERFWMVIYPQQITSLRHVWEHPDIPDYKFGTDTERAEEFMKSFNWLENYAKSLGNYSSSDLVEAAKEFIDYDERFLGNVLNEDDSIYKDFDGIRSKEEFWIHFEIVTGIKVPDDKRQNFFACSC